MSSNEMNLAQALNDGLFQALENDDKVLLFGEDVGRTGGVFRISDGLLEKFGSDRIIDAPVAESGIVGTAFGMAVGGLKPIVEIQFIGFSYPGFDQIISHVSRIRNRSNHRFTCPIVIRMPFGGGIGAAEHHSESSEALYVHTPGLKVVVPSTPYDAKGLLLAAVEDPDPVIFLEPIRLYRAVKQEVPAEAYTVPIGKANIRREGNDITLIAWGALVRECTRAADALAQQGHEAEVIDLRTLSPIDTEAIISSVQKTGRAVVAAEAHRTAGVASEIAAQIQEHALDCLLAPVQRVTGLDTVVPLKRSERQYQPTADAIVTAALRTFED